MPQPAPKRRRILDDTSRLGIADHLANPPVSVSHLATRTKVNPPKTLAQACLRCISVSIPILFSVDTSGTPMPIYNYSRDIILHSLPPHLLSRLFTIVLDRQPNLGAPLMFFLRADITTATLPAPSSIASDVLKKLSFCKRLAYLDLSGQAKLKDNDLARVISSMPFLETLVLRGCINVGDAAIVAASKVAGDKSLSNVNLNYTAVTPKGLVSLISRCKDLQVLKLASVNGLGDKGVSSMIEKCLHYSTAYRNSPLLKLQTLKLRGTSIGEAGLSQIHNLSRKSLKRLDISFTSVRRLTFLTTDSQPWIIEKLLLDGLSLSDTALIKLLQYISKKPQEQRFVLKYLSINNMGAQTNQPIQDSILRGSLPYLESLKLEKLCVARNSSLGMQEHTWREFFDRVGAELKYLDLTAVSVKHTAFEPIQNRFDINPAQIETFLLNNTQLNDKAMNYISYAPNLQSLYVSGTHISTVGLENVLRSCSRLDLLDLTSCRGIPIDVRRNAFQIWEEKGTLGSPALTSI